MDEPRLTEKDIELVKCSKLYQLLAPPNRYKFFYDWYNEACIAHENDKIYTVKFNEQSASKKSNQLKKESTVTEKKQKVQ